MTFITDASSQLFSRPADEHYADMQSLLTAARDDMANSREVRTSTTGTFFEESEDEGELQIALSNNDVMNMSHYSMRQIAQMAGIRFHMLERLMSADRTDLVVDNLNTLFPRDPDDAKLVLVRDLEDDGMYARAVNGVEYSRLWDYEMFGAINEWLIPMGFSAALPTLNTNANQDNIMGNNKPALFRGDQTSFGFFFNDKERDDEQGDDLGGLRQGIMVWNSEVGAKSFGYSIFYFQDMCANFLIWHAKGETRKRYIHRGNVRTGFATFCQDLQDIVAKMETRRDNDLVVFAKAATTPFAANVGEAIEKLNKVFDKPKAEAEAIIAASRLSQNANGDDLSVWRIANGITWEAGATSRTETLVDDSAVAAKIIRRLVTV